MLVLAQGLSTSTCKRIIIIIIHITPYHKNIPMSLIVTRILSRLWCLSGGFLHQRAHCLFTTRYHATMLHMYINCGIHHPRRATNFHFVRECHIIGQLLPSLISPRHSTSRFWPSARGIYQGLQAHPVYLGTRQASMETCGLQPQQLVCPEKAGN